MSQLGHHIGGTAVEDVDGRTADVFDPATGAVTCRVALADATVVDHAVTTAHAAWRTWRHASLAQRAGVLFAFRELVANHLDDLAATIVAEHGKVRADARGEVQRGLEVVEFACGIPHLLGGTYSANVSRDVDSWSLRQPLGVVAGITPFNFPAMVPMWMFPIAIACGNTFVLKPSERDPSTAMQLAGLWSAAGLPDGVFNVLNGDAQTVDALLTHPDLAAVSFVGSTPVARRVFHTATGRGTRVQALGGAKNHMVVLPDADLDVAADAAVAAAFGSAGERCMAIATVVAVGDVADRLVPAIAERMARIRVGPGDDPRSEMGPLITRAHRDRVAGYVAAGVEDGFWLGPCLLDHVTPDMTVYRDEIFGPVLGVVRVADHTAAIELVNANPYGNGTAVFTADGGEARRFQHDIEVGMVGINVPIPVPMAYHSFGGWKDSLFGDTHVHGPEGVRFYTRAKVVTARWPERPERSERSDGSERSERSAGSSSTGGPDLHFPTTR